MSVPVIDAPAIDRRTGWSVATGLIGLGAFVAAVALAPSADADAGRALTALLLFGYTAHIASTAWFATLPEFRAHARENARRFLWLPVALTALAVALVCTLDHDVLHRALLPYFGWQFWHFQKQNLGVAALAANAHRAPALSRTERRALLWAGGAGVAALLTDPRLLQLDIAAAPTPLRVLPLCVFAGAVACGLRPAVRRASSSSAAAGHYLLALLFFTPVFVFDNPYAAVAGLTIAHSWQYLLMMGLLAAGEPQRPERGLPAVFAIAVLGGLALAAFAEQPASTGIAARAAFGIYLGVVMTHFVVDADVWRLREKFARQLIGTRLPYLIRG